MFKAYLEARPSVTSQYDKECDENCAVKIGLLALGYTEFVSDNKEISKFIQEMRRKGI